VAVNWYPKLGWYPPGVVWVPLAVTGAPRLLNSASDAVFVIVGLLALVVTQTLPIASMAIAALTLPPLVVPSWPPNPAPVKVSARVQSPGAAANAGWKGPVGEAKPKSVATFVPGFWAILTMACKVLTGAVPAAGVAALNKFEQIAPFELTQPFKNVGQRVDTRLRHRAAVEIRHRVVRRIGRRNRQCLARGGVHQVGHRIEGVGQSLVVGGARAYIWSGGDERGKRIRRSYCCHPHSPQSSSTMSGCCRSRAQSSTPGLEFTPAPVLPPVATR